jgi:hypothetical protein
MPKYPQTGDVYESLLYPGETCRVVHVSQAQVTFEWLGPYSHIDQQVVPVSRFIVDFSHVEA